jgi:hypothetical protein
MSLIHKKSKASYTVEATFIMLIVLSIVFALIYLTFYLCDKSKIQSVLDLSVIKISEMLKQNGNIVTGEVAYQNINQRDWVSQILGDKNEDENIGENYIKNKLMKGIIIAKIQSVTVDITYNEVKANVKVKMNMPLDFIKQFFSKEDLNIQFNSVGSIHNPAEYIRVSEVSLDTIEKVNGAEEIIHKLKQVLDKVLGEQ